MNVLSNEKKILILQSLVEGNSIRSIERISGVHRDTIMRLLVSSGKEAQAIMEAKMVNLKSRRVQVDEIWSYVGKKQANLTQEERRGTELGDQYTFVAMDADTKLVPCHFVGKRNLESTYLFLGDLRARVTNTFQLSTDSFAPYKKAVDDVFGCEVHYGQIHKEYREEAGAEKRYSPANIVRVTLIPMIGTPDRAHISTSYIERQNLTMRMQMRRFTRLTNGFSKKLENLKAAVSLHFFYYNFMRIHQSLRVTPAQEAGLERNIWTWENFLGIYTQARQAM